MTGRPSTYTEETADELVDVVVKGDFVGGTAWMGPDGKMHEEPLSEAEAEDFANAIFAYFGLKPTK